MHSMAHLGRDQAGLLRFPDHPQVLQMHPWARGVRHGTRAPGLVQMHCTNVSFSRGLQQKRCAAYSKAAASAAWGEALLGMRPWE